LIHFLWEYLNLAIKVTGFGILTLVKSSRFLIFFLRVYISLMIWVTCPWTLDLLFIRLSSSYDPGHGFGRLTQLTHSLSLSLSLSLLIDFFFQFHQFILCVDWELGFVICFGLFFIRLSWSHDSGIVLKG